jgi:signal transduction histidine kinase
MDNRIYKWFKNVSIKRKLYFVVGIMTLLIIVELFTLWFSVKILSSVRAYVGGEGLWSKAQKDAAYYLQKYGNTHDEKDYAYFLDFLKVPMGDAKARGELAKANPDFAKARQGFIEGQNFPDDVDGMIWLFRNFNEISYIKKAIIIWGQAEPLMIELIPIGEKLHREINSPSVSQESINKILNEIEPINQKITKLENAFSFTLGEGSRWLENLILKLLLLIAVTVEFTGLFLTVSVSIAISKGIKEVVRVSDKVARGDFSDRAILFSNDEIGALAQSFNDMVSDLNQKIIERNQVEESLILQKQKLEDYSIRLEQSNKDLEQFAYVASHDLREPLRTINSYVQLLENRYKDKLDSDANEFIQFVVEGVNRMDILIVDLLSYSQVSTQKHPYECIDCSDILEIVIASSNENINKNRAKLIIGDMPSIYANKQQMILVFQNLINNAIKFHREIPPEITISVKELESCWQFSVSDNGIGIEKKYEDRIFIIFQRLNSREIYEGTGIGLTICKKIIEQHEGKIWFESELNKGSTFYFTIKKNNECVKPLDI